MPDLFEAMAKAKAMCKDFVLQPFCRSRTVIEDSIPVVLVLVFKPHSSSWIYRWKSTPRKTQEKWIDSIKEDCSFLGMTPIDATRSTGQKSVEDAGT